MARLSLSPVFKGFSRTCRAGIALGALAIMTGSCLLTSTPQFRAPARTAPFLLAEGADPPLNQFVFLDAVKNSQTFSAPLRSDDADEDVQVKLYVDYGYDFAGDPFLAAKKGGTVGHSTMDDQTRHVEATFKQGNSGLTLEGCHTLTLIASHHFGTDNDCPVCLADSSELTWFVVACPSGSCPDTIDPAVDCVPQSATPKRCPAGPQSCAGTGGAGGGGGSQ